MGARAIWKGRLDLGAVEVPVRFYAAVQDRGVHFRLLQASSHMPVVQRMVDPDTGAAVPPEAMRRGLEVEPGLFVEIADEELAALEPKPDRRVELLAFVAPERIAAPWYDRPYWLGPDGDDEAYFALAAALGERDQLGIARWTMRRRRCVGALHAEGPWLMISTLRHLGEVIPREALGPPPRVEIDPQEALLAEQLVGMLAQPGIELAEFRDEHRERVLALVEAKARGETPTLEAPAPKPEPTSLADSLRQSLEAAGRAA
jgi:DNA end-binding protein Ku